MPDNDKNHDGKQDIDVTAKMPFSPDNVELTQKIDVDKKIIDENKSRKTVAKQNREQEVTTSSLTGKSIFSRKRITDDYVKSSTVLSKIDKIHPLKNKLELQDVHSNYELKDQFSEGAQGVIRKAFDKSLKRDVVVKSLKVDESEEHSGHDEHLFVSEARIMAQLDHPSIIPLYGLHCEADSKLHLAMKHIHGKTLQKYLKDIITLYEREGVDNFDEKRSIATRIEYIIRVCEAVDYAHRKGVVHRDLKPENIMIGNYGEVYVMDWGLACLVNPEKLSDNEEKTEMTQQNKNELVGTPCYIAPELIRGGACSPQSDIFSLGMILFEVVTLNRAVSGKTVNEVLKNIVKGKYAPFKHRFIKKKLSDDLKAIIAKATCDFLPGRYQSAGDMANDLKLYLMREETAARPDNIFRKFIRSMINHKMITSVVVLSILLCLSISTIYSLYSQNALMKTQEDREAMLTHFQDQVSQRANKMERVFYYFNTQLTTLAYQAQQVLARKPDKNIKIYTLMDFLGKSPPPDYALSPAYGIKISLDYPIIKRAKFGEALAPVDIRAASLTPLFKHMTFASNPAFKGKKIDEIKKIIMQKGAPLNWITLGMKNGTMFAYPGTSCYPKDYDPRTRPWYKKAFAKESSTIWSEPFRCALSHKILMSTTTCVYDENNVFQGVAGLHIRLDYVKKYIFGSHETGAKEYLITPKGQVILSSDFRNRDAMINHKSTKLIMTNFAFMKEFRNAVKQHKVQFEAKRYNTKYLFALNRLPSLGYYYIQRISEKRLRSNWENKKH
jgi:serine/threonine-protein kinase